MQQKRAKYIASVFILSVILLFNHPVKAEELTENLLSEDTSIELQLNEKESSKFTNEDSDVIIEEIENQDNYAPINPTESMPSEKITESETLNDENTTIPNETEDSANETETNPSEIEETIPDINPEEETDLDNELKSENEIELIPEPTPIYEVQEINGKLYLVNVETGEYRQDNAWVENDGKWYFPNADGVLYRNQGITFGSGNLYYLNEDGEKVINQIVHYANNLYLLDDSGKSRTDNKWVDLETGYYFPNLEGKLYKNCWITFGPNISHYMGDDGAAYLGVRELSNNLYLFDDINFQRGVLRKDNAWVEYESNYYFPNTDGVLYRNQGITFGSGNLYYLNEDGEKVINQIVHYANNLYLLDDSGKSRTDNKWVDLETGYYFPNLEGKLYKNCWITFGPNISHYMGDDGAAYLGVRELSNNLYLFDDINFQRGVLRKDNAWVENDGKWYFPNADGVLYRNQGITFGSGNLYYLNEDGEKVINQIVHYANNLYLLDDSGKSRTDNKWVEYAGNYYFPNASGQLYRNQRITFGPNLAHYMGNEGYAVSGIYKTAGNLYYYQDKPELKNPEQKTAGWIKIDNDNYYVEVSGILAVGRKNIDSNWYYFDNNGKMLLDRKLVVFLDPGHGGSESGAHEYGVSEKTLNLQIANLVRNELESLGYYVIMSRTDDTEVSLLDRSEHSNAVEPDIFVSIHHNAMPNNLTDVNGIVTFYYEYDPNFPPKINEAMHNDPVRLEKSRLLSEAIQKSLIANTGAVDMGVDRQTFAVLRETAAPATLVELGFMTNYNEFLKITNPSYQKKLASGVVSGINEYFAMAA